MPIHDWTRVEAGIFHHFHHSWIDEIARTLNRGLLPPDHYALAEQIAGGLGPDVLTLQRPSNGGPSSSDLAGGVAVAVAPPKAEYRLRSEPDQYAAKAKGVVIRHASNHRVVAIAEIVSPGNKSNRHGVKAFVDKACEILRAGVHLLIVDLFPPGPRDPRGLALAVCEEFTESDFESPSDRPLTLASYIGGRWPDVYLRPAAVGTEVPEMPLFLTPDVYVPLPLEATYQAAWESVPAYWRDVLTAPAAP
jgi:hypothetical protein